MARLPTSIRLHDEDKADIEALIEQTGITAAVILRKLVKEGLRAAKADPVRVLLGNLGVEQQEGRSA